MIDEEKRIFKAPSIGEEDVSEVVDILRRLLASLKQHGFVPWTQKRCLRSAVDPVTGSGSSSNGELDQRILLETICFLIELPKSGGSAQRR